MATTAEFLLSALKKLAMIAVGAAVEAILWQLGAEPPKRPRPRKRKKAIKKPAPRKRKKGGKSGMSTP